MAYDAHESQYRAGLPNQKKIPYIVHPVGTALIAIELYSAAGDAVTDLETIVCTSILHDVLEDTFASGREIENVAGSKVREYVESLTKPSAGISGMSRSKRNEEFFQKIVNGGPSVAFVKLCDSMHNLSRPASMPPELLRKPVEKGRNFYCRLLDQFDFGVELRDAYSQALENADEFRTSDLRSDDTRIRDLSSALKIAGELGSEKPLEIHDIASFFEIRVGAVLCDVQKQVKGERELTEVSHDGRLLVDAESLSQLGNSTRFNSRDLQGIFSKYPSETDFAVLVKERLGASETLIFAVLFDRHAKNWICESAVAGLIRILTQRLLVGYAENRSQIGDEASALGLKLDVAKAQKLQIEERDLSTLWTWIERCREASRTVEYLLNLVNHHSDRAIPVILQTESRVKSPDAIVEKFLRLPNLQWPRFRGMEDIAGVRAICLSRSCAETIIDFVSSESAERFGVRPSNEFREWRRDFVQKPTNDGYRAVHLILDIGTGTNGATVVPCELQIRTLCEDTWAKISHVVSYKNESIRRRDKKALKRVSEVLKECQLLADELIDEKGRNNE